MNEYHKDTVNLFSHLPSIDAWFPTRVAIELHNGCEYSCRYCPANWSENWQEKKVVLHNPIIKKENQKQLFAAINKQKNTVIGLGAGYTDPFPPQSKNDAISQQYEKMLEQIIFLLLQNSNHLLIMTKNPQKLLHLLQKSSSPITRLHLTQITLICSIMFPDDQNPHAALLEPHLPTIKERWSALGALKKLGASVGIAYLPIIGGVNDDKTSISNTLIRGKKENIDFCLFGALNEKAHHYLAQKKILTPTKIKKAPIEDFFVQTLKKLKILPLPPIKNIMNLLSQRDLSIVYLKQLYLYQNWMGKSKEHLLNAALSLEKINDDFFQNLFDGEKEEKKQPFSRAISPIGPQTKNLLKTLIFKKKTTYLDDSSKFFK